MSETIMVQTPTCFVCGMPAFIEVLVSELDAYRSGSDAQFAFRSLDAAQRELIITGTHEHCWEAISSGIDDE